MDSETRIVKFRDGQYGVQAKHGYLAHWWTIRKFSSYADADKWRCEQYADEVVEVLS